MIYIYIAISTANGLTGSSDMQALNIVNLRMIFCCLSTLLFPAVGVTGNVFTSITTCSCVGQSVLFNCTTSGDGFTVWSGSAFTCTAREITLTHNNRFTQSIGSCTDGIVARGIAVDGSAHTSQLNVTLSAGLVGRTVDCTLDSTNLTHIGAETLVDQRSLGPFPAPRRIILNSSSPDLISFTWNNVEGHDGCSSLRYIVNSTNCGTCSPTETMSNLATCIDFRNILLDSNNTCNFTIQSVICDDIAGNVSSKVITLKVPDPPIVQVLPIYRSGTPTSPPSLIEIVTNFRTVDSFIVSNDPVVNGSARSYTITYSDSATGLICYSATILNSSCFNGSCNHTFEESKSECPSSANISIAVFATNVLGNGSFSATIERSGLNRYVNITFSPMTRRIQCTFLNQTTTDGSKECNATVTYGDDCDQTVGVYPSGISSNTTVTTPQIELIDGIFEYCLTVTARNGNVTVMVRGNNIVNIADPNNTVALAAIVTVLLVFGAIVTVMITVLAVVYIYKYRSKTNRLSNHEFEVEDIHWIKFSINERSSLKLSDALEIFKRNDVKVLEVNTNLLQSDIEANGNSDHTVYFVLCTCTEEDKDALLRLTLDNLEEIKEFNPSGPGSLTLILKFTLPKETPEEIVGAINLIEGIGNSRIRCINTQHKRGKFFVKVRCTNTIKAKLLESLVDELDSDGDSIQFGPIRTRRVITCLVREEATGIKSVLEAFTTCQLNITEVNPKYVPGFDLEAPRNPVDGTNYVECCCPQESLSTLQEALKEPKYGILKSSHLSSDDDDLKELQDRSSYKHHHVVRFSLMNCEGALSYAMSAFADSGIRVIGLNTIKCPPEELNIRILYRRSRLSFAYTESEKLQELKTKLNATGTAIVTPSSEDTNELIHVLIMEDEISVDGKKLPLTIQDVFDKLQIHLPSNDLDCPESNYSVVVIYQRMGILYKSTDEQKENLEKQLRDTGLVIGISSQNVPSNHTREQTTMV